MNEDDFDWLPEEVDREDEFNRNNMFKKSLDWVLWSSVDSEKISLTLKAGVAFLVLIGVSDTDTLNTIIGSVGNSVVSIAQGVAGILTAFGLARKVWNSVK